MGAFIGGSGAGCSFEIGFVLHGVRIGTKEVWGKLGLMGFVFLVAEGGFIFLILCHNSI